MVVAAHLHVNNILFHYICFAAIGASSGLAMSIFAPLEIPSTASPIPNFRDRYLNRLEVDLCKHHHHQSKKRNIQNNNDDNQQRDCVVVNGYDLLCELVETHLWKIPFENLAQHGGKGGAPVSLDLETIASKILDRNRGGFCLELNTLFAALLRDLGYGVTVVPAIVGPPSEDSNEPAPPPTHIFLAVTIPTNSGTEKQQQQQQQQTWMVDVGFGEPPLHPLKYVFDEEQVTPEGMISRFIQRDEKKVELEWYKDGKWKARLQWDIDAPFCTTIDAPLPTTATTTTTTTIAEEESATIHEILKLVSAPTSIFSTKLIVVRLARDVKQTLAGSIQKRTGPPRFGEDSRVVLEELDSLEAVRELLKEEFGIPLEETERLDIATLASQDPEIFAGL